MNLKRGLMIGIAAVYFNLGGSGCATFQTSEIDSACSAVTKADSLESLEELSWPEKRRTLFKLARSVVLLHQHTLEENNCYRDLNYNYEANNGLECDFKEPGFNPKKCGFVVRRCNEEDNLCEHVIYSPPPKPKANYGTYKLR